MTYIGAVIAGALCGLALLLATMAPAPAPIVDVAQPATNDREAFALDLLARLGNAQPSAETVVMVVEWTLAEDAGDGAMRRYNPLNTTQPSVSETQVINGDGVRGYADYEAGMDATIKTLTNGYYDAVVAALQANDPEGAKRSLWDSPWAGSHYGYGASWPRYEVVPPAEARAQDVQAYVLAGDVGVNVRAALNANGGALRRFTLAPGASWSFGRSIAPISALGPLPVVCGPAGCNPGGGWCDLAAMYVRAARQLGLRADFPPHAGVSDPDMPGILLDEWGNGGDLILTNTTGRPVTFEAFEQDGALVVQGG